MISIGKTLGQLDSDNRLYVRERTDNYVKVFLEVFQQKGVRVENRTIGEETRECLIIEGLKHNSNPCENGFKTLQRTGLYARGKFFESNGNYIVSDPIILRAWKERENPQLAATELIKAFSEILIQKDVEVRLEKEDDIFVLKLSHIAPKSKAYEILRASIGIDGYYVESIGNDTFTIRDERLVKSSSFYQMRNVGSHSQFTGFQNFVY